MQSNISADKEQRATQERIAASLENIASTNREQAERTERSPETAPCDAGNDQRNSDLCAQWKAADAAGRAALFGGISIVGIAIAIGLTIQSNRIARETAKRQLRAYVGWDKFDLDTHKLADGKLIDCTIFAVWINSGQTPATELSDSMCWTTFKGGLADEFDFPEGDGAGACGKLAVGPGRTFQSTSSHKLGGEDFWAIADKKLKLVAWSAVDYKDAFGSWRRTEVAAELVIDRLQNGQTRIAFNAIPRHNGIDDCCMRRPFKKNGERS